MEIIEGACIDVVERARDFAIKAHKGDIRKSEPDKPKFMHVFSVAKILESYNFSDEIIAAGYLHDVIEDTKYSFNFTRKDMIAKLEREFGSYICSLVQGASEPSKSLSWKERKQHTINETKKLSFENKVIICADKINNLEDLYLTFEKNGTRDFSAFNSGDKNQRWYYTSMYESLIYGEDESLPIFKRLKNIIDKVYPSSSYNQQVTKKDIRLRKLTASVLEVKRLKALNRLEYPFVVEFTGTPRTFEKDAIDDLGNFFSQYGFHVKVVEDYRKSVDYDAMWKDTFEKMSPERRVQAILNLQYNRLLNAAQSNKGVDLVLAERSIVDMQLSNYIFYNNNSLPIETYLQTIEKYKKISKELIDFLVVSYADELTVLRKDYSDDKELEHDIPFYNDALFKFEYCNGFGAYSSLIDTSLMNADCFAMEVAEQLMPQMRKKYIKSFKDRYKCD